MARVEELKQQVELTIAEFKEEMRKGVAAGVGAMARALPRMVQLQIEAAEGGDQKAQQFIISSLLKLYQPDMLVTKQQSPMEDFLNKLGNLRKDFNVVAGYSVGEVQRTSIGESGYPDSEGRP